MSRPSTPPNTVPENPAPGPELVPEGFDTLHHQWRYDSDDAGAQYDARQAFRKRQMADMRRCLGMLCHADRDPVGLFMEALQVRTVVGFILDDWEDRLSLGADPWTAEEIIGELRAQWDPRRWDHDENDAYDSNGHLVSAVH